MNLFVFADQELKNILPSYKHCNTVVVCFIETAPIQFSLSRNKSSVVLVMTSTRQTTVWLIVTVKIKLDWVLF